jgi:hypothetical protein
LEKFHQQYLNREKLLDRFGGAEEAKKARAMVLSDAEMKKYEEIYDDMKEFWAYKLNAVQHAKLPAQLCLQVNSSKTMLAHFEGWYDTKGKEYTLMFGEITEKNVGKFLAQWNVQFAGEC